MSKPPKEDEVLLRMLKTPPKPHAPLAVKIASKRSAKLEKPKIKKDNQ